MPRNPSLKRSADGAPPGPGWWYAVHFQQPGPGVLPSVAPFAPTMTYAFPAAREASAHHESDHAVIAFLSGIFVIDGPMHIDGLHTEDGNAEALLHEDPELLALRRTEGWVIDQFEQRKQRAVLAAAGYAAEKLFVNRRGRAFDEVAAFRGAHGDVLTVQEVWGTGAFLAFVERVTAEMLKPEVWEMIERLPTKLLTHPGPLPAAEATALLNAAQADTGATVGLHLPELRPLTQ